MKCYSLSLGARNTPQAGRRFSSRDEGAVRAVTRRHFPEGFTMVETTGGWFDPARQRFVKEESRQILVCTRDVRRLRPWCRELAARLQQRELLVVELGAVRKFQFRFGGGA